jgi:hypothetical protein
MSTAIRWAQRLLAEGHARARAMGGDHRSRLVEHRAAVLELVVQQPDLTLQEFRGALTAGARNRCRVDQVVAVSQGAEDYAQKKSLHAAEQDRPVAEARRAFIRRQPALDATTWCSSRSPLGAGTLPRGSSSLRSDIAAYRYHHPHTPPFSAHHVLAQLGKDKFLSSSATNCCGCRHSPTRPPSTE